MKLAERIFDDLRRLPKEDLRQVVLRAQALDPGNVGACEADEELVWAELGPLLNRAGHHVPDKVDVVMRKLPKVSKALRASAPIVASYVREHFQPRDRIATRRALRLVLSLVLRRLSGIRGDAAAVRITQELKYVDGYVEREFPGYAASGLLPMVLRAERQVLE